MRVLWHSQAPWMTGSFGQQTALVVPRLRELGFEVAISAGAGLVGGFQEWQGIPVYPGDQADLFGHAALQRNARLFKPDVLVTLVDVCRGLGFTAPDGVPLASFAPVEHAPLPMPSRAYFEHSKAVPLAVTRNGQELLRVAGFEPRYTPHGVDATLFRPRDRAEMRAALGLPQQAFLVGMVAVNKPDDRKSFGEAFEAFARFRETRAEALLVLQTTMQGGTDLMRLAEQLGIGDALLAPNDDESRAGLFTPEQMARTYSSLNVLLAPSRGEGFGLPLLEAQACGVPVITTDFGAMAEVGVVGWKVGGQRVYVPSMQAWYVVPDISEIAAALESAYDSADSLAQDARAHALSYDIETVVSQYLAPELVSLVRRASVAS